MLKVKTIKRMVTWFGKSHYLLANVALVGEAIILAMRTSAPHTRMYSTPQLVVITNQRVAVHLVDSEL